MDSVTPERELSDFEKGVIDGALLAGASRARAIQIAMEASPVMASQVSRANVADDVVKVFNEMKAQKDKEGEEENSKRKKVVLFCLSEDKKSIVLEEGQEILQEDVGNSVEDPLLHFAKMLPPNDCRYALYDATYHTRRVKRKDLVFIFWAPEGAPLESRMIYSRSRVVMKKKLAGIRHEWEVNSLEDAQDRRALARKLGGRAVVSLEGSPV